MHPLPFPSACRWRPNPRPAPGLITLLAALSLATSAMAQSPSTVGQWSQSSPSRVSPNTTEEYTPIHMAWMRGQDDWETNPSSFHSFLFFWESRVDACGISRKFQGSLYGWRPGGNTDCVGTMLSSGFTLLDIPDAELDPGGDANGHNIFCSGNSMLDTGELIAGGGAGSAENNGTKRTARFSPLRTGNRWVQLDMLDLPRWYPTIVQTASTDVYTYAGLQYARSHIIGGSIGVADPQPQVPVPATLVARPRLNDNAGWDSDQTPLDDTEPDADTNEPHPLPRLYAGGGAYRVESNEVIRTVMFGGKDGNGNLNNDVWWLKHNTNADAIQAQGGQDLLSWFKFTSSNGLGPSFGLWKQSVVVQELGEKPDQRPTSVGDVWVWGGQKADGSISNLLYRGKANGTDARKWDWTKITITGDAPAARYQASTAYDEKSHRMIVYGGYTGSNAVIADNEVWALDLNIAAPAWHKLTAVAEQQGGTIYRPSALAEAALIAGPSAGEHMHAADAANLYMYGGMAAGGAVNGDVWLVYFPNTTSVVWKKLPLNATVVGPGARRGAIALRDVDSWNLRVCGGTNADGTPTDGRMWLLDIYRTSNNIACDTQDRTWKAQYDPAHGSNGRVGALAVYEPYEVPANSVERIAIPASGPGDWTTSSLTSQSRFQNFYPLLFPLANGRILDATARIFGRATDVFDPAAGTWAEFTPPVPPGTCAAGPAQRQRGDAHDAGRIARHPEGWQQGLRWLEDPRERPDRAPASRALGQRARHLDGGGHDASSRLPQLRHAARWQGAGHGRREPERPGG